MHPMKTVTRPSQGPIILFATALGIAIGLIAAQIIAGPVPVPYQEARARQEVSPVPTIAVQVVLSFPTATATPRPKPSATPTTDPLAGMPFCYLETVTPGTLCRIPAPPAPTPTPYPACQPGLPPGNICRWT